MIAADLFMRLERLKKGPPKLRRPTVCSSNANGYAVGTPKTVPVPSLATPDSILLPLRADSIPDLPTDIEYSCVWCHRPIYHKFTQCCAFGCVSA